MFRVLQASYPTILDPKHPDLVLFYTMDNVSGSTLIDEGRDGKDGAIVGATFVSGWKDNAINFDATDESVDVPSTVGSGAISLSFWMSTTDAATSIAYEVSTDANNYVGALYIHTNYNYAGTVGLSVTKGLGPVAALRGSSTTVVTDGSWRHVILIYDKSGAAKDDQLKFYIGGVAETIQWHGGQDALTAVDVYTGVAFMGERYGGTAPYTGKLDQFRIFNRTLTQDEITTLANE